MEIKIYGIDTTKIIEDYDYDPENLPFNEDKFIYTSQLQGNVWSLEGFQSKFNDGTFIIANMLDNMYIYIK
jgi:hypothetical protein